jgi:molybdate transport system permease protein
MNDGLWTSLAYSLLIAVPATALAAVVAVPVAYLLGRHGRFRGRSLVEAAIIVPLVLPPTVVGFVLIMLVGRYGLIGRWIAEWTGGYSVMFRPEGGILAAAVVAMPLIYLPAKAAFVAIEREMEDIARLSGANTWQVFWHVSLPTARHGLTSGLILAFARALGEFGATVMVMGVANQPMTLPVRVYDQWLQGQPQAAAAPALMLSSVAFALVLLFNRLPRG